MFGTSYFPNALYDAIWRSRSMLYYTKEDRIDYLFTGDHNGKGGSVRGFGSLSFRNALAGKTLEKKERKREVAKAATGILSGMGYFIESSVDAQKYYTEFIRLTREEIRYLVPEWRQMHPASVIRKFIEEYHRLYGDHLSGGILDPIKPETKGRDDMPDGAETTGSEED